MSTLRKNVPPAFHILVKPTGASCNLSCSYCFFLSKKQLYPGSSLRMTSGVLERYIQQLLVSHQAPEVTIAWQGGEPTLMGLDFFRLSVSLAEKYKKSEQQINYTIQTNGTRLNDEWGHFLQQHRFLVGLSIDGPKNLHDNFRTDKRGRGSFDRVMQGWNCLKKHKVDFNILCTVNAANANHPVDIYCFFRDMLKTEFMQFIPVVEQDQKSGRVTEYSVTSEQYGVFLIRVFDEWVRRDVGTVFVQQFDAALANWLGVPPSVCTFAPTCGTALALEHNGDLYPCDHFVTSDRKLGNIQDTPLLDLISSARQYQFGRSKLNSLPKYCRNCKVCFACNGGCPKNRFIKTANGESGLNYLCTGYKSFFAHIDKAMRIMTNLLRQGYAADEVMKLLP